MAGSWGIASVPKTKYGATRFAAATFLLISSSVANKRISCSLSTAPVELARPRTVLFEAVATMVGIELVRCCDAARMYGCTAGAWNLISGDSRNCTPSGVCIHSIDTLSQLLPDINHVGDRARTTKKVRKTPYFSLLVRSPTSLCSWSNRNKLLRYSVERSLAIKRCNHKCEYLLGVSRVPLRVRDVLAP